jgi:hypothetical protein
LIRIGAGDTIFVADGSSRISVFSPSNEFVRTFDVSGAITDFDAISDSRLLVVGQIRTPAAIGYMLHTLSYTGAVARSFGTNSPNRLPTQGLQRGVGDGSRRGAMTIRLTADRKSYWGFLGDYAAEFVELATGRRQLLVVENVPWLPPPRPPARSRDEAFAAARSQAVVASVYISGADSSGRLWATAYIPKSPDDQARARLARQSPRDQVIEVLDPRRKELIVSTNLGYSLFVVPGTNFAFSGHTDQDGIQSFVLRRLAVVGR